MNRDLQERLNKGSPELKAVRAFLVSVDGETVIEHYSRSKPSDYAHVWSVTKSVMSILVGIAVADGDLRLDQTLEELLPSYRSSMSPEVAAITLRQLLTMTAGFPPASEDLFSLVAEDTVGLALSYGLITEPGEAFAYSNSGSHLVAAALTEATGRPVLEYARQKLFDPLGIDTRPAWHGWDAGEPGSGFDKPGFGWGTDRKGIYTACCWLKLTAGDMVRIGELYLNEGRWRGQQIVPAGWVRESTSSQLRPEQQIEGDYGYFWWVGDAEGHHWFAAQGSFGRLILVVPDLRLVVAASSEDSIEDSLGAIYDVTVDVVINELS